MNLLCLKIWSGRNVAWLLSYCMVWLDLEIYEIWKRNWREKGERKHRVRWRKKNERGGFVTLRGFTPPLFIIHYIINSLNSLYKTYNNLKYKFNHSHNIYIYIYVYIYKRRIKNKNLYFFKCYFICLST